MKKTLAILTAVVFVGALVSMASAEVVVTIEPNLGGGPSGEDVYDFVLSWGPEDGEFTNARLIVSMEQATIEDPIPMSTQGGPSLPMDTWCSTVFDVKFDTGTSFIYNAYKPLPPDFEQPPVALLDWSFYDTLVGDDSTYSPATIARVLTDPGAVGTAKMLVFTTANPGTPNEFNFQLPIPEPATLSLLGFGLAGILLRRRRK